MPRSRQSLFDASVANLQYYCLHPQMQGHVRIFASFNVALDLPALSRNCFNGNKCESGVNSV